MSQPKRPETALIGAGRIARAFLPLLVQAGYPVTCVAARRLAAARAAVRGIPGARATSRPAEAARRAMLILVAVPDSVIPEIAVQLAQETSELDFRRRVVLHHAGALGPEALAPLRSRGASIGLLHPFQCLGADPRLAARVLPGSRARIEGDRRAVTVARQLARDLGLVPLRLKAVRSASSRTLYHASASLLSNDVVALLALAAALLEELGASRGEALATLTAIARGSLSQAEEGGIAAALSGPAVRGDHETLQAQIRTLKGRNRRLGEVHRLLSAELLRIARLLD